MSVYAFRKLLKIGNSLKRRAPETRLELKQQLDHFSSGAGTIKELQICLSNGQPRTLKISEQEIIVSMQKSKTNFFWRIDDPRTAIACLAVTGEYEVLETKILKFFASNSEIIFDVGANVGYYAIELGIAMRQTAVIHSFEPIPESFEQLQKNVILNSAADKVICNQSAISNSEGEMVLYKPRTSGSSASSARNLHPNEEVETVEVPMTTLDKYMISHSLEKLDLLKIDVEGSELMVVEGALESIQRHQPVIFAELLRKWCAQFGYSPNLVLEILFPLGYRCFAVSEKLPEVFSISEETKETNFLFIPKNRIWLLERLYAELVIRN
jgi:FkbM family methyltransferase